MGATEQPPGGANLERATIPRRTATDPVSQHAPLLGDDQGVEQHEVVVVGAGLAGLACAGALQRAGRQVVVLEASDGVGGRVRTDFVDGYQLDRGFQALPVAYPAARALLDLRRLELQPLFSGALVRLRGRFWRLGDPRREPRALLDSLRAPVGSPLDTLAALRWALTLARAPLDELLRRPERSARAELAAVGLSDRAVEHLWGPFFANVLLDPALETSSRLLTLAAASFVRGGSAIPARGMGAIAEQLASTLAPRTVRLGQRVVAVEGRAVRLGEGIELAGSAVVVATDGAAAATLLPGALDTPASGVSTPPSRLDAPASGLGPPPSRPGPPPSREVTCAYFSAPASAIPVSEPAILLDGDGEGPASLVFAPTNLNPFAAPAGRALLSATVVGPTGPAGADDDVLARAIVAQLRRWWGARADELVHLRTYRIPHALPAQLPGSLEPLERPVALGEGRFVCGDHRDTASIQGALASGLRAASAVAAATSAEPAPARGAR